MENLKRFKRYETNKLESFETNGSHAPRIESFSISKKGTILMLRINGEAFGYFLTE